MTPACDVLLVTVTSIETKALLAAMREVNGGKEPEKLEKNGRPYRRIGNVNGASIVHTRCEQGASGPGSSLQAIEHGIRDFAPGCVIMVGIAFGMDEKKQQVGDVLVSQHLSLYDLQKIDKTGSVIPRGSKPDCSPRLLGLFRFLEDDDDFTIPLRFGTILSGEKLVDNLDYRESLQKLEREAIGGEMEGQGLYTACQTAKIDWILVKAICDWADGNKSEDKQARQELAARNAAQAVAKVLTTVSFKRPEVASPRPFDTKLRTGRGTFVGRENSIEQIGKWALSGQTGVLCLWGPGGVGKTRLAEEAGLILADTGDFDLIKLVSFEALKPDTATGQQVASTIALGLGAENVDEATKDLPRFVKSKGERVLLILDNFESADNADTQKWLADFAQSGIRCLVTSRKQITVHNVAQNLAVTCLEFPTSAGDDFDDFPSVELFRDRLAESVKLPPYGELSVADREGLVEILKITNGFPLAIEIVAANRVYASGSLKDIAEKLGVQQIRYRDELGESGGGAERHESMAKCFQWSLDLLPLEEAQRFVTLGVLPYDFGLEAAETICGVSKVDLARWWQRSLVQQNLEKYGERWSLLPLLKEYTWNTCSEEIKDKAERNSVRFFSEMIKEHSNNNYLDINIKHIRDILEKEWQTICTMQILSSSLKELDCLLSLSNIVVFLQLRGLWQEQEELLINLRDTAITYLSDINGCNKNEDSVKYHLATSLNNLGIIFTHKGSWDKAIESYKESLELFMNIGDIQGTATALMGLGTAYFDKGMWNDATNRLERSLSIFRHLGDLRGEIQALGILINMYLHLGRFDEAIKCSEDGLNIVRYLGDIHGESQILGNIGNVYRRQNRFEEAIICFEESLKIARSLGDTYTEGNVLGNLGSLYSERNSFDKAINCCKKSLQIKDSLGDRRGKCQTLITMGNIHSQNTQYDTALSYYEESLSLSRVMRDTHSEIYAMINIGNIYREKRLYQKAIDCHRTYAQIALNIGDIISYGKAQTLLGIDLAMNSQLNEAIIEIKKGIDMLVKTQDIQSVNWSRGILEQVQQRMN